MYSSSYRQSIHNFIDRASITYIDRSRRQVAPWVQQQVWCGSSCLSGICLFNTVIENLSPSLSSLSLSLSLSLSSLSLSLSLSVLLILLVLFSVQFIVNLSFGILSLIIYLVSCIMYLYVCSYVGGKFEIKILYMCSSSRPLCTDL